MTDSFAKKVRNTYPMGTKQDEGRAQERFRGTIETVPYGATAEKLHGGMFQNGLPDLVVCGADGVIRCVEMKAAWNQKCVTYQHAFDLLRTGKQRSRQQVVCTEWGLRQAPVFIVIGDCVEENGNLAWTALWLGRLVEPNWASRELYWTSLDRVAGYVMGPIAEL